MEEELDNATYEQIQTLSETGNALADEEDYLGAASRFQEALDLLPAPRNKWEAALWLHASIGDMKFLAGIYDEAVEHLYEALNCEDGPTNPFVQLRMGQSLFETGDKQKAVDHLLRAYMLEGNEIFESEDPKYFSYLQENAEDIR